MILRIVLAGGGTGGHIYPLVAVHQELKKFAKTQGIQLDARYFGGAAPFRRLFQESGVAYVPIVSSKWRRYFSVQNFLDIPKFFIGFIQALWKLYWFMPDVIFSKGGPGVPPILCAAAWYRIPIVMHESDSVPGAPSLYSARLAKKIFVGFASAAEYFVKKDVVVSGVPIRSDLADGPSHFAESDAHLEAKRGFGFSDQAPLILILGGSQGMGRINDFILENLKLFLKHFQILHQVGEQNYGSYKKEYEFVTKDWSDLDKNRYQFRPYFGEDLREAYVAADFVLARSGATTIYELAFFGKPALLVPLPEAAQDHQRVNAYNYERTGAAVVIEQENFLPRLVVAELEKILNNPEALKRMGDAARSTYRPDAASIIAQGILQLAVKIR